MRLDNFNFYCSNNFLLLHLNSDGIEGDNIQSLGHGLCLVKRWKLFTLCKIQSQRRNSAWGAEYPLTFFGRMLLQEKIVVSVGTFFDP